MRLGLDAAGLAEVLTRDFARVGEVLRWKRADLAGVTDTIPPGTRGAP